MRASTVAVALVGFLGLTLVGSGCSSTAPDMLVGNWAKRPAGYGVDSLGIAATFNGDGSYAFYRLQFLSPTVTNSAAVFGSYVAADTDLTLAPTQSSCVGPAPIEQMPYTVSDSAMTFTRNAAQMPATYRFVKDTSPPAFSGAVVGCFRLDDETEIFTPASIVPISNS
jgi:hypothetical protein